jgi:lysophospholipase L1-like esterase
MAFGDSLTEGEWWPGHTVVQTLDITKSYPTLLLQALQARYVNQPIEMWNEGLGGSRALCDDEWESGCPEGPEHRFTDALMRDRPQVVLLLQGINDLFFDRTNAGITKLITALRDFIINARLAGAHVFLSTLTAERRATVEDCPADPNCQDKGKTYFADNLSLLTQANNAIKNLALTESGVTLVDGYAITNADVNKYVGADGVHLSIEGYQALAAGFLEAIKAKYEVAAPVPQWSKGPSIASIGADVEVRPQRPR